MESDAVSHAATSGRKIVSRQARPVVEELRELREICRREHGPAARSTRMIEECLAAEERTQGAGAAPSRAPGLRER